MDRKNVKSVFKKRGAPVLNKEFKFQLEPKRSNRGQGPIRPRLRTKEGTLASTFSREVRNPYRRGPSPTPCCYQFWGPIYKLRKNNKRKYKRKL
jgi:hypothetical protein